MIIITLNERITLLRKDILKDNLGKKLSVSAFSEKLGVNRGVIENIEYNRTEAKDNVIKLISLTFNVRDEWLREGIEPIFNEEPKEEYNILKELEKQGLEPNILEIIKNYINMDSKTKSIFNSYLTNLVEVYKSSLKKQGQKAEDEISITSDNTNNIISLESIKTNNEDVTEIKFYDLPVLAGTGVNLLEDVPFELIKVSTTLYPNVSFALRVSGDSMEPRYFNGDIVYIKEQATVDNGQIGIFYYNDNAYLKKFCIKDNKIYLISLNENYKPIEITNESFKCVGLVL